jgi:hypothetical protein
VGFTTVNFRLMDRPIGEADRCNSLPLSPTTLAMLSPQPLHLPYTGPRCDGLDFGDGPDDLEVHQFSCKASYHSVRAGSSVRIVDSVPRSTNLVLVSAFAGIEPIRGAYREAIRERYRFYSYGDAMLIL